MGLVLRKILSHQSVCDLFTATDVHIVSSEALEYMICWITEDIDSESSFFESFKPLHILVGKGVHG
jgi:hypothetical protein